MGEREIKFRITMKDKKNNEIFTEFVTLDELIKRNGSWYNWEFVEIISKDQFTGLFDKNGKEIYEGDKVKDLSIEGLQYSDVIATVHWDDGCFVEIYFGYCLKNYKKLEVIGNIYEEVESEL